MTVSSTRGPCVQGCLDNSLVQWICGFFTSSSPEELKPFWGSLKDSSFKNSILGTGDRPGDSFNANQHGVPPTSLSSSTHW